MNANTILNDDMSLEAKLKAIDEMMKEQQTKVNTNNGRPSDAPVDPSDLLMCEGCQ